MTTTVSAMLARLNQATERTYAIVEDGCQYRLLMPTGGSYDAQPAQALAERMLRITLAAEGRMALPPRNGTLQRTIDFGAELSEYQDWLEDEEWIRRGC